MGGSQETVSTTGRLTTAVKLYRAHTLGSRPEGPKSETIYVAAPLCSAVLEVKTVTNCGVGVTASGVLVRLHFSIWVLVIKSSTAPTGNTWSDTCGFLGDRYRRIWGSAFEISRPPTVWVVSSLPLETLKSKIKRKACPGDHRGQCGRC